MKHKTYKYTKETIAKVTGYKIARIRRDIRNGVFNPDCLQSTAFYVLVPVLAAIEKKIGLNQKQ